MKFGISSSILLFSFAGLECALAAKYECSPSTWELAPSKQYAATRVGPDAPRMTFSNTIEDLEAGDVNCQDYRPTYASVNCHSCQQLAFENRITIEDFILFNPELNKDCSNIRPYTYYCTDGCKPANRVLVRFYSFPARLFSLFNLAVLCFMTASPNLGYVYSLAKTGYHFSYRTPSRLGRKVRAS